MSILDRWTKTIEDSEHRGREPPIKKRVPNWPAILRDVTAGIGMWILISVLWPFYSVPTGSRGVVTQFGRIVGIEDEGLAVLPPWRHLTLFSIRAEEANIDNASGSTSDTQPVSVSLTVRYSISPDKVSEVYE